MTINSVTGNTLLESGLFAPCRVATTAAIALSGLQTIDGIALAAGDRVLVWQQADKTTNGIYAASSGPWVRTTDAASNAQFFDGMAAIIARGTQAGLIFQCTCTDDPVVVGTSLLTFAAQATIVGQAQSGTSTTTQTVGLGSMTFATQSGKSFAVNQWVLIYDASVSMLAQITAYAGGSLTASVVATSGSGTRGDWSIVLTNSPPSAGLVPPIGTGNVTGPGGSTVGHLATFADGTGKVLADAGAAAGTLAGRNTLLYGDAGPSSIGDAALVSGAAPLPYCAPQPNDNLHLVNDVANPTRDINVTPGRCRGDSDLVNLQLSGTMVKRLDQAWAPGGVGGAPAGACDAGVKGASQTWHIYLIGKRGLAITSVSRTANVATVTSAAHGLGAGGTVRNYGIGSGFDGLAVITAVTTNTYSYANAGTDVGATGVSATADGFDVLASQAYNAAVPSGWTDRQCLGSFLTDGSGNLLAMTQIGDEFLLGTFQPLAFTLGSLPILVACAVPLGVRVLARLRMTAQWGGGASSQILVSSPDEIFFVPNGNIATLMGQSGASYAVAQAVEIIVRTNIAGQVRMIESTTTTAAGGSCYGWRDPRRRLF